MMADLDEELYQFSRAEEIESGHIYEDMRKAAAMIGVEPAIVFKTPSKVPNAFAGIAPNGRHCIGMTQGMLDLYGASQRSTPELKAFIGHELGHLVRRPLNAGWLRKSPMIAVPSAAVMWYSGVAHKNRDAIHALKRKEAVLFSDEESVNIPTGFMAPETRQTLFLRAGQVAIGGFLFGAVASNKLGKEMEFMCDRYGAMVSSPEGAIGMLKSLEANGEREVNEFMESKTLQEKLDMFLNWETAKQIFAEFTHSSHPSTEARVARLSKLAKSIEASAEPQTQLSGTRFYDGSLTALKQFVHRHA